MSTLNRLPSRRSPDVAGLLSLFVPGFGQIYNGRILAAIFWFIVTPGFWIGTGGLLGWVCHLVSAYTAYTWAEGNPDRNVWSPTR